MPSIAERDAARADEAAFRAAVPDVVSGFQVVDVVRFSPGGTGAYAAAVAVCWHEDHGHSTHLLVRRDDLAADFDLLNKRIERGELDAVNAATVQNDWYVTWGHYGFDDVDDAREDARKRA